MPLFWPCFSFPELLYTRKLVLIVCTRVGDSAILKDTIEARQDESISPHPETNRQIFDAIGELG